MGQQRESDASLNCFKNMRNGMGGFHPDWYRELTPSIMAEGFAHAARVVSENRFNISPQGDVAFWPVVFLYRHAIELLIKEIIHYGSLLNRHSVDNNLMSTHALKRLWDAAKPLLNGLPNDDTCKEIDELVADFEAVDPRGDAFRYYRSKSGTVHLTELPGGTSIEFFVEKAGAAVGVLDGAFTGILEALVMRETFGVDRKYDE